MHDAIVVHLDLNMVGVEHLLVEVFDIRKRFDEDLLLEVSLALLNSYGVFPPLQRPQEG